MDDAKEKPSLSSIRRSSSSWLFWFTTVGLLNMFAILRISPTNNKVVAALGSAATKQGGRGASRGSAKLYNNVTNSNFATYFSSSSSASSDSKYYTIGITGANGLIGTALRDELSKRKTIKDGKEIRTIILKRGNQAEKSLMSPSSNSTSLVWNPNGKTASDVIDPDALNEMDAIIHLSGENISTGLKGPLAPLGIRPWTDAKKQEILDSRTITTSALAKAIGASTKTMDFLVASGVGAYGKHFMEDGPPPADESSDISKSDGFLAEVSRQWEGATSEAKSNTDCRIVNLRNGVVLSTKGGAMAKLYPIFLLGGGGNVGSGKQYFPFISARDMARAMIHVLETPEIEGPVNMCTSGCTNQEFTSAMGNVLNRPTLLPFPGFAVSLMFGEMGEEVLLGGVRAQPQKLLDTGFEFLHPTVEGAVQSAVDETI